MADDQLPEGMTCVDCGHWRRCKALISTIDPTNTRCDWDPSRFQPKQGVNYQARIEVLTDQLAASQERCRALEREAEGASELEAAVKGLRHQLALSERDRCRRGGMRGSTCPGDADLYQANQRHLAVCEMYSRRLAAIETIVEVYAPGVEPVLAIAAFLRWTGGE